MRKKLNWSLDKSIVLVSVLYVIVPIIVFCYGWLKLYYAIPSSLIFGYFAYKIFKVLNVKKYRLISKENIEFWIITVGVAFIWVYLSGIGGYSFQNSDYWARNPIYRDLCDYSWPVIFDLSNEPEYVQNITGASGTVAFSYYFSWWLVPALVSKVLGLGDIGRNLILYLYAVVGILCVIYGLMRYFGKRSYLILTVLILFSGLDVVGYFIVNKCFPSIVSHIEWWSGYFQISSNTTLLYWVFNQAIPIWILITLMLQIDTCNSVGLASLSFAYSPWATMGIVPIALGKCLVKEKNEAINIFKSFFTISNIATSALMLVIYGLFYTCGLGNSQLTDFSFLLWSDSLNILIKLIAFWFLEVIIFYLIMGKTIVKYDYYIIVLLEFLIMPLLRTIQEDSNWLIRGLIPASFILMVYCMKFLMENDRSLKLKKTLLIIILVVGAYTPMTEILRPVAYILNHSSNLVNESVYSMGNIQTQNEGIIEKLKNQFFKYEYEESIFFEFLAK